MVNVRNAELSDCREVFEWRNDDISRQMARSSELVLWKNHLLWYENSLTNHNRLLLICESQIKRRKLGVVRFDFVESGLISEISINISPYARGKGYARECLKKAISYMVIERPECKLINADIKKINEVSKFAFEQVGFKLVSEDSLFWQYQFSCPNS